MRKYQTKRLIIILMILCFFILPFPRAVASDQKVIRVGYPIQEGLTMKDDEGNYYGYTYDYLMQVAQYTGWKYEFVEIEGDLNTQLTKLLDMLSNGEIDLMGSMRYNDAMAELYDYPSEPYGSAYNVLLVKNDSDFYDQSSLFMKKDLKIAVLNSAKTRVEKLDQFAEMNGFTYEKVIGSEQEILSYMEEGKADVMLGVDLEQPVGYRSIARFSPDSFYFATTKGNYEIVSDLNQAILDISKINPLLETTLYNRYFSKQQDKIILNDAEKAYVKAHPTIRVLVKDGYAPMENVVDGEPVGIGKDILEHIAAQTGLKIEYRIAKDYENYQSILKKEHIDLLMGLPYDITYAESLDVNLTSPYVTGNLLLVARSSTDINDLEEKLQGITYYSNSLYDQNDTIQSYESTEAILKDIEKGKLDYAYLDSYQTTYYMNKLHTKNITTFATSDYLRSQYAFGISRGEELSLLGIVNKGIQTLDDSTLNAMIYENGYMEQSFDLMYIISTHLPQTILILLAVIILIMAMIFAYYRRQLRMKRAVELEYQRYLSLSMITGEMTFEYHYIKDSMKISGSGVGKISKLDVIEHFQQAANEQEVNEHMVLSILQHYLNKGQDVNEEVLIRMQDGHERWYQLIVKVIQDGIAGNRHPLYAIGKVLDIQEQKLEKEQLVKDSFTDPLTGIYNRAGGMMHIEQSMKEHAGALMMVDLDKFKEVNDQYGHFAGDEVLIETAELLNKIFVDGIVSRFGGDEYIIFLPDAEYQDITRCCEQLLSQIQQINFAKEKKIEVTISMGVVFTKANALISDEMKKADKLLYESKFQGRNRVRIG